MKGQTQHPSVLPSVPPPPSIESNTPTNLTDVTITQLSVEHLENDGYEAVTPNSGANGVDNEG